MSTVVRALASTFLVLTLLALSNSPAYAQGGTTSTLSGVAVDSSGAVLPGADVTVTMPATGFTQSAVTNADGAFSFPGLNIGTYTLTVKLSGFKTFVSNNVALTLGGGANVRATLEIGGVEEQVVVSSASEIIQTQSTQIASTINTTQILKLPLTTRSAMDFVTFLPGVQTSGGNRASMINGLPQGMINITLDGVNIQDNTLRSTDGFFAIVSPRLDAIEEVTVTTAAQGADSAQGSAQIKFTTRSGTNTFTGSLYEYYRRDALNANTWFNNRDGVAKAKLQQDQFGGRAGGPITSRASSTAATRLSSSSTTRSCGSRATRRAAATCLTTDAAAGPLPLQHGLWCADCQPAAARGCERTTGDARPDCQQAPG